MTLPKQNTGLGPEKTSFFQALAIGTKITRGTIEIMVSTSLRLYNVPLLLMCLIVILSATYTNLPFLAHLISLTPYLVVLWSYPLLPLSLLPYLTLHFLTS